MEKRFKVSLSAACMCLALFGSCSRDPVDAVLRGISRGENATIRIEWKGSVFYVDPTGSVPEERADAVFVSHRHSDHYDALALSKLGSGVPVYAPFDAKGLFRFSVGDRIEIAGISVEAVPSYNIVKKQYHPKQDGNAGFVFTLGETRVYIAGDTERISEMKDIKCDIAIVPLGQVYTMRSVDDAVEAVLDTGASVGVPTHYGYAEGKDADAAAFVEKAAARGVRGVILPPLL
ncbi:MAG TPA: MBL fold metallo-hydrolase [Treponemataceae bacterium]|nr:MBL fold metallo-hydrolase [Treponemataceae bacterium]HQL34016.1 MBL fold metallo-hydrolase [Treponemataceae bacterium]